MMLAVRDLFSGLGQFESSALSMGSAHSPEIIQASAGALTTRPDRPRREIGGEKRVRNSEGPV